MVYLIGGMSEAKRREKRTAKEHLKHIAARSGAPRGRTGGGWLADLAALEKAIVLCDFCVRKWNPRAYDYKRRNVYPGQRYVVGPCDGCGQFAYQASLHLHKRSKV